MNETQAAKGMGWFSLGLGAAQLLAPQWLGRQIGVGHHPALMRAFGAREMLTGLGVLKQRRPETGMQARVAGDALDLAMLGLAATRSRRRQRVALAVGAVAAVAALDYYLARRL